MNSRWVAVGALAVGLASFALADVTLYQGRPAEQSGITLLNWGDGLIEDSTETSFGGGNSLKVTTRGLFSGGWIAFNAPVDLSPYLNQPNKVLRFTFRFPGTATTGGGGFTGGGGPRGGFGEDFGGPPGQGPRGGPGGFGAPGAPPGPSGSGTTQTTPPPLREIRVIFQTADGKWGEFMLPLTNIRPDDMGWNSVSMPLAGIPSLKETNGQIRQIGFFGDAPAVFYVGEIRTLTEQTPLQGYIVVTSAFGTVYTSRSSERITVATGDELTFAGVVEGVTIPVAFRWNFGGDPEVVDGEAPALRLRFPKRGTYTVFLTIADPYGTRPSTTSKITIQVN